MKVRDKVLLVTGGGNGMGKEVVLEALRRGARVAAADIRQDSLDSVAELAKAGDRLSTHVVDVTDREATSALPASVIEAHGSIDGMIHCAGIIQPFVRLNELEYEDIERVINVNLYGTINMVKAVLPELLKRPVAHVANVSSMGGYLPVPGQTVYGATKAGVKLMTEGLYAELLDTNVGVSVVFPGAVATDIASNSGVGAPGGMESAEESDYPTTSPDDAARIILDGVEDDQFHIYIGRDARTMNLLNRAVPRRSTHIIYKQMKELLGS
ncbi:MAG TPA: SDR family oxidoreductase [Acidimicrobiia bacterium]|nr:SDR family oxidoreductase [Acidimicrobiia bacterium]